YQSRDLFTRGKPRAEGLGGGYRWGHQPSRSFSTDHLYRLITAPSQEVFMAEKIRSVHYLNQFFAQIGGGEKTDNCPRFKKRPIGPRPAPQQAFAGGGGDVGTRFCVGNYFAEHAEEATEELLRQMTRCKPHLLIAGPAFESGRYGVACGAICKAAQERLGIYAVAGMDQENAGAALYCKNVYIINSGD